MSKPQDPGTSAPEDTTGTWGSKETWDVVLKVSGTIATAAGIVIGVWQYNSKAAEEKEMEFKRTMYTKKLAAYEKVGQCVANLLLIHHDDQQYIETADVPAFDSCEKVFRELYWGAMPLVQDTSVERMMIRFGDQVHWYRRGEDPYDSLVVRGVALMNTCKGSLKEHWQEAHETSAAWIRLPGRYALR